MNQPIYVTKPVVPPLDEYIAELADIWDSRILTNMGTKHQQLETALREFFNVPYFYLYTNGHLALEAALQSLDLPMGGEVITTPFTFVSTTQAILRSGLTPVFCDIKLDDCTIDPSLIEALITPRTCAILPVHVYGNLCDVDAIGEIAARHGLPVVYDAAHAFGAKRLSDGKSAGSFGDISMFSLHATKVFHTFEGGGLAFHDPALAEKLEGWRNFGQLNSEVVMNGGNAKMSEANAAMGLCNLRHLKEYIAARKRIAEMYMDRLQGVDGLTVIPPQHDIEPNYSYFPILVNAARFGKTRDELFDALARENIFARKYFYPLTSRMPIYPAQLYIPETPAASELADQIITLPLYPDLCTSQINQICEIIYEVILQ